MNTTSIFASLVCLMAVHTSPAQPTLKERFKDHFRIGVALNDTQCSHRDTPQARLAAQQFNSITPENVMKWEKIQPVPGSFDFAPADRYVEFGERHGMFIVGHTLIWHSQTPRWVFENGRGEPADRETLLSRMSNHIHTVVGRYKGRIKGWDVVNEALSEDGSLRQSPWLNIIGEDYLAKAFEFAHDADPDAELYYNDYSLENPEKRRGAIRLITRLKAAGAPVSGLGTQMHVRLDWPTAQEVDDTLTEFGRLGIKIMVTELDVDVLPSNSRNHTAEVSRRDGGGAELNPYTNGLPAEVELALSRRYEELFRVYLKHSATLERVTFWGVTDGNSWLNNWPVRGRTSYPLLFDRQARPKPAFDAVIGTAN
jgi:endo-1,4-beta-xylanase